MTKIISVRECAAAMDVSLPALKSMLKDRFERSTMRELDISAWLRRQRSRL
jgi:hypothetical protein